MATFRSVFFAITVLVATSSAAPRNNKLSLKIPDECKGKGFCSIKPEGYAEIEEIINSLLPKHLFAQNLDDRIGDGTQGSVLSPESDWHNCPYKNKTESIYSYSHNNDSKMDIIIQTELLYQPIQIITCANEKIETGSQECFQHLGLSSLNMKSSCQTSTATRRLLVFDPETHQIKQKEYAVPCCCTCKITSSV